MLGSFRVIVNKQEITEPQWVRRKPALLIKLLAVQPQQRLHREQAMELLWANSNPAAASNNLHKAIHLARRTLEPDLKSGVDCCYILSKGQQIALTVPEELFIDTEKFEQRGAAALKSDDAASCAAALSLYSGDLLKEDLYEDWTTTTLCRLITSRRP